jgi:hypothetical protein
MLAGSEPQLEDLYINTADFELKEKDVLENVSTRKHPCKKSLIFNPVFELVKGIFLEIEC